jgi:hypothetical protein
MTVAKLNTGKLLGKASPSEKLRAIVDNEETDCNRLC